MLTGKFLPFLLPPTQTPGEHATWNATWRGIDVLPQLAGRRLLDASGLCGIAGHAGSLTASQFGALAADVSAARRASECK